MFVLENVLKVDDSVGLGASGEHGDLVEDLHGAVHAAPDAGRELGGVHHATLAMCTLPDGRKKSAENEKKNKIKFCF